MTKIRRRHEAWDWPPEEEPRPSEPRLRRPLYYAPPGLEALGRRTPWWGTGWGRKVSAAIFYVGVMVWKIIIFLVLMTMMVAGLWLLVALFR